MKVNIKVNMTVKAMFEFLLYHNYANVLGVMGYLLGFVCVALGMSGLEQGDSRQMFLFFFLGAMILIINPFMLWTKAAKQVKTIQMFKEAISYEFSEEGIVISQNEVNEKLVWDNIAKVVEVKNVYIIFISRIRAFILTKESVGEDTVAFKEIVKANLESRRVKLK